MSAAKRVLNPGDISVLQLIADGGDHQQLEAAIASNSPTATRARVKRIMDYLGADNRAHAVAIAMRRGLIK